MKDFFDIRSVPPEAMTHCGEAGMGRLFLRVCLAGLVVAAIVYGWFALIGG